jgi:hypothetical protein
MKEAARRQNSWVPSLKQCYCDCDVIQCVDVALLHSFMYLLHLPQRGEMVTCTLSISLSIDGVMYWQDSRWHDLAYSGLHVMIQHSYKEISLADCPFSFEASFLCVDGGASMHVYAQMYFVHLNRKDDQLDLWRAADLENWLMLFHLLSVIEVSCFSSKIMRNFSDIDNCWSHLGRHPAAVHFGEFLKNKIWNVQQLNIKDIEGMD